MRRRQALTERQPEATALNSLQRGLEALRCFRPGDEILSVDEIARRLTIPKTTTLRLLITLEGAGFLKRLNGSEEFSLYRECLLIGQAFLSGSGLARKARPVLQAFADRFNMHVLLCLSEQRGMLVLLYLYGKTQTPIQLGSGHILPVGDTALGHAWLWKQTSPVQGEWLAKLREQKSSQIAKIYQSFHNLENGGVCWSSGDVSNDATLMAAPLSTHAGSSGAIGCFQTDVRVTSAVSEADIKVALRGAAERIRDVLQRA
jgi:IclR family transcriptional regulator, positive regulator for flagellar biogenesis